jgi:hypothetical protein
MGWRVVYVAYEIFKRSSTRVETPTLAITPQGRIFFNAAACRLLIEFGIKTAVIFWDKARNKVAIKAAPKGEKNAFVISLTDRHSASLTAKSFLHHVGWNAAKRETLATTWNPTEKMFEVTLPPQYLAPSSAPGKRRITVI